MRLLFLVFHGFYAHNGISKKITAQVQALRRHGVDVQVCCYNVREDGTREWTVDGRSIAVLGKGPLAKIRRRLDLSPITEYALHNDIDVLYYRSFHNANPITIAMLRKLKAAGIKVLLEIPTYPYDGEYGSLSAEYLMDRLFRRRLCRYVDKIVTFSDEKTIFGRPAINISNGIDFDALPLRTPRKAAEGTLNLIAVAEIHFWHGFDRLLEGLGRYSGPVKVHVDIVGECFGQRERQEISAVIEKYGLGPDRLTMHGARFGKELDALFDNADIAIGSLARHRSGITSIKTLKNREYAARGFAFVYSETDSDFDSAPYVLKVPADESPADISAIVDFALRQSMTPAQIRESVASLGWDYQMGIVLENI